MIKLSVIAHSVSGNTARMAQVIAEGMKSVPGVEARAFSIDNVEQEFVRESKCIVVGCPTYVADTSAQLHLWMEKELGKLAPAGKLGGAFATAQYIHGGGELTIRSILDHMLTLGMLTYSGGGALGRPVIHLGPVAIATAGDCEALMEFDDLFRLYGQRMAQKAMELFA